MEPKLSIITITYNAELFLEQTIQSIIKQTYTNIEYIIIDGKSKDKTVEIIQQHQAHISYWASESDTGLYDAMNKGLAKATGDYVWFVNAGDLIYDANTVRLLVDSIKTNTLPDIIYGETALINNKQELIGMRRLKAPKQLNWKSFQMGMLVCHQSFIVARKIATPYNLSYRLCADFDWCIRCLKEAKEIHNSHLILSRFLEDGISSQNRKRSLKERYQIMCKYYGKVRVNLLHLWFALRFYTAKWITGQV